MRTGYKLEAERYFLRQLLGFVAQRGIITSMNRLATLRQQVALVATSWRNQRLFRDRLSVSLLATALLLNAINLLSIIVRVRPTDYPVPIHYSSLKSFDMLGPWYDRYWLGVFGLAVTVVNAWLAMASFQRSRIASFFFLAGSIVAAIFCLIISNAFVAVT